MSRLPSLGPRGEGWFALQVALLGSVALAGPLGPAWEGPLRSITVVVGLLLMAAGGLQALRGIVDLGSDLTPLPRPRPGAELRQAGIYARVRHPIYGGLIMGAGGWGLAWASPLALLATLLLAGFLAVKAQREEAWLREQFPGYAAYAARTRMFLIGLY
ncbi:MAG: methyltransferase family protein [Candidatus Limnocylindrales bacterium]